MGDGNFLDLNKLAGELALKVETENPMKVAADLKKAADDAAFERWTKLIRDVVAYLFAIGCLIVMMEIAIVIIHNAQATADDKKWATALLAGISFSAVGFVLGKETKK